MPRAGARIHELRPGIVELIGQAVCKALHQTQLQCIVVRPPIEIMGKDTGELRVRAEGAEIASIELIQQVAFGHLVQVPGEVQMCPLGVDVAYIEQVTLGQFSLDT